MPEVDAQHLTMFLNAVRALEPLIRAHAVGTATAPTTLNPPVRIEGPI